MLQAIVWGVVQGITEFLPISSDGHLVLVPAFLNIEQPDLAITAVLHLGTLVAVIAYFRNDLLSLFRFRSDPGSRRMLVLMAIGTIPAFAALLVEDEVARLQQSVTATAIFLMVTGVVMLIATRFPRGTRTIDQARPIDAASIGIAQVLAILPGLSRSGMTISTGMVLGFGRVEAARFSFLLSIPAVAGAGLLELGKLTGAGGVPASTWVGVAVAAITGYLAIALLLRLLARTGLIAFAIYCLVVGGLALVVL
ncbi:MAG: undecaprenyl-diphosphate phosphatase [Acidimicrobiia bacterium]